jgi:hypothetical protein
MQTRRSFLSETTVTLLLIPIVPLFGCSSSNSPSGEACTGVSSTSTNVGNHTHTICVLASDLATPPAGGATYTSTNAGDPAHTHTVTLSMQQLQSIASNGSVTVTSSSALSHTHDFMIQKA